MFSLFCVLAVVAQLTNSAVHAAAIVKWKIRLVGFMGYNQVVGAVLGGTLFRLP
jgi:hypothetical protein